MQHLQEQPARRIMPQGGARERVPGHPRPQGASVQAECHGSPGRAAQKGESVGTNGCLPALLVSKIVAPWIVAGQGKDEFPEAFNQIGMHTDVV